MDQFDLLSTIDERTHSNIQFADSKAKYFLAFNLFSIVFIQNNLDWAKVPEHGIVKVAFIIAMLAGVFCFGVAMPRGGSTKGPIVSLMDKIVEKIDYLFWHTLCLWPWFIKAQESLAGHDDDSGEICARFKEVRDEAREERDQTGLIDPTLIANFQRFENFQNAFSEALKHKTDSDPSDNTQIDITDNPDLRISFFDQKLALVYNRCQTDRAKYRCLTLAIRLTILSWLLLGLAYLFIGTNTQPKDKMDAQVVDPHHSQVQDPNDGLK